MKINGQLEWPDYLNAQQNGIPEASRGRNPWQTVLLTVVVLVVVAVILWSVRTSAYQP